jgi:ParB/RepB/Spo0J family partition protein
MNELFRLNRKPKQNQKPLPDVKEFRTDHLSREVEDVKIVEIIIGDRIRDDTHTDKSIADLASSIEAIGLLQPIVLNEKNNMLVCGERRLEAYKKLGRKEIPVLYVSDMEAEKLLRAEADENIQRKGFSFFQIMAHVEKIEEEVAKRREAGDESVKGEETRDLVAKAVGWGYKKLSDAKTIMQNAIPEVIQAIGIDQFGNGLSIHSAFKISQLPKNQQLQALRQTTGARSRSSTTPVAKPSGLRKQRLRPNTNRTASSASSALPRTGARNCQRISATSPYSTICIQPRRSAWFRFPGSTCKVQCRSSSHGGSRSISFLLFGLPGAIRDRVRQYLSSSLFTLS